jgi:hypothetical protein
VAHSSGPSGSDAAGGEAARGSGSQSGEAGGPEKESVAGRLKSELDELVQDFRDGLTIPLLLKKKQGQ